MFKLTKHEIFALVLIAAIYFLIIILSPNGFWIIDEGNKFIWANNLYHNGSFNLADKVADISPTHQAYYPKFSQTRDNGQVSVFSPFFLLLTAPFAAWGGMKLALFIPAFISILLILVARRLAIRLGYSPSFWFIALLGVGSPLLFYSVTIWEHGLAALLVILAVNLAVDSRREEIRNLWAGMLFALAFFIRPETMVFSAGVWWFLLERRWRVLQGLLLGLLLTGFINHLFVGSVIPLQVTANTSGWFDSSVGGFLLGRLNSLYNLLFESSFNIYLSGGAIAAAALYIFLPGVFKFLFPLYLLILLVISWFDPAPFWRLGERVSLLFVAPLFFVTLFAKTDNHAGKKVKHLLLFVVFFTAIVSPVSGGMHFGPRLLIPVMPLLAMAAIDHIRRVGKAGRVFQYDALIGLAALQFLMSVWGISLLYGRRAANYERVETILAQSNSSIITMQWWLQQEMPKLNQARSFFMVDSQLELKRMLIDYYEKGIRFFTVLTGDDEQSQALLQFIQAAPPKQIGVFTVDTRYPSMNLIGLKYAIGFDVEGAAEMADELGVYFGQMNNQDEAERYLRKATRWVHDEADYHYNLGYCLGKKGRYYQALEEIEIAHNLEPDNEGFDNFARELRRKLNMSR